MAGQDDVRALRILRKVLFAILVFGLLGTAAELLLLEHTENIWQKAPLILIGTGLVAIVLLWFVPRKATLRIFQIVMALSVAAGVVGVYLHFDGNQEFELEMSPELSGMPLYKAAMMGAFPALAPGTMMLLGLVGLAAAYRHPALERKQNKKNESESTNMNESKSTLTQTAVAIALAFGLMQTAEAQLGKQQGLVDPNLATKEQLVTLPHLNEELAGQIIEQRPFLSITNLNALLSKSLSAEQLTELYGKAFVHINLNKASREEIMLIPGAGRRMAHEFDEYRPYKALAQFRREIGKYVDDKEVARLEQYVFLPINLNTAGDEDILSIPGVGNRMLHEFKEYRPYQNIERFRREIGKYVDKKEVSRLERYVTLE